MAFAWQWNRWMCRRVEMRSRPAHATDVINRRVRPANSATTTAAGHTCNLRSGPDRAADRAAGQQVPTGVPMNLVDVLGSPDPPDVRTVAANGTVSISSVDWPYVVFKNNDHYGSVYDSFVDYVMFQPAGAHSIWVTLRTLNWNWSARYTADFGLGRRYVSRNPRESAPSSSLPTWTGYYTPQFTSQWDVH